MAFFDYDLPADLIAQQPPAQRGESRLLALNRATGEMSHRHFRALPELLRPGDLLILNDTRVLPARLVGRRENSGGQWQGLFLAEHPGGLWEMMCQTRRKPRPGEFIQIEPGPLRLELIEKTPSAIWLVRPDRPGSLVELLTAHGRMPIPHYIRKGLADDDDEQRYQTVFARQPGAIAAPTAGLHFTTDLFERLKDRSIEWAYLTLHVGIGTFLPIRTEDYRQHVMHREWGELPAATVESIQACRARAGRVVAVGTTSVRVLETVAATGPIRPWSGQTDLFIYHPFEFRAVNALITNFHLPRSTLLLLVGAFAGADRLRAAYAAAVEREYRFYSYGDAMYIE